MTPLYKNNVSLNSNTGEGQLSSAVVAGPNETFLPFDEERYIFMRPDGTTVALNDNQFAFSTGNTVLQIRGLGAVASGCTLIATLRKSKISSKAFFSSTPRPASFIAVTAALTAKRFILTKSNKVLSRSKIIALIIGGKGF